tara:strand:- start:2382 stop:2639 length:258 start_codon:yes stop_codon:yes gene_type:complete
MDTYTINNMTFDNVNYSDNGELKNFIHFDTIGQAELFKRSYRNLHYGHDCCGGKGFLVYNKTLCELNDLKNQFLLNNVEKKKNFC